MESGRRAQVKADLNLTSNKEVRAIEIAKNKELERQAKKERKKQGLEDSLSYKSVRTISKVFDDWWLDPIIGLVPVVGDIANAIFAVPFIYVSLVKVRSIPLTLACIANIAVDVFLGIIPFWIGNIVDFFNRSYRKNLNLIIGFIEDDKEIIDEVNRKAVMTAIAIAILCLLIYWLISFAISMISAVRDWIGGLF